MSTTPSPLLEYLRPWKLFTLAAGIALLVIGALRKIAPDWDIPISFIMALLAYLTAPWSLRVLLQRRWKLLPWRCSPPGSRSTAATLCTGTGGIPRCSP